MKRLLKRLWFWYGKRTELLVLPVDGMALYGEPDKPEIVYRGKLAVDGTIFFDCRIRRVLIYNRVLTDAEIELLRSGWKFDQTVGATSSPPAFSTDDFTCNATINLRKP